MKKAYKFGAIAAAAALSLAACGQAPDAKDDQSGAAAQSGETSGKAIKACMVSDSGGFEDKSFNQSGHEGLMEAKETLGVQVDQAESKDDTDYVPNIANMVQGGCDVIIGVGFLMADAMNDAAKENPDVKFALVDSTFADAPANARALVFNTAEASYLAGYAAAGMTQTGKVGTYVGMNIPATAIFADGFSDGVAKYNEAKGKSVTLLGWDKEKGDGMVAGSFEDTAKGKQFTEQLMDQGADIIMPVAGQVGLGTLSALAGRDGNWAIWVDADGYVTQPEYGNIMLTSVMKDISNAVYDTIESVVDDKFDNTDYVGTLANGGVSIAPWHDFDNIVPDELKSEIDGLKQDIMDGKITVETKNKP